jgi:hypothetical protein
MCLRYSLEYPKQKIFVGCWLVLDNVCSNSTLDVYSARALVHAGIGRVHPVQDCRPCFWGIGFGSKIFGVQWALNRPGRAATLPRIRLSIEIVFDICKWTSPPLIGVARVGLQADWTGWNLCGLRPPKARFASARSLPAKSADIHGFWTQPLPKLVGDDPI